MGNLTDLFPVASSNNIIESFSAPADGRSVTVKSGTYTLGTVTGTQEGTETYAEATGSSIDYVPPSGTKYVLYRYDYQWSGKDYSGITSLNISFDGTTVTMSERGISSQYTLQGAYAEANFTGCVEFVFDLTVSTTNKANGQIAPADWTTAKTIKANYREYRHDYESILHRNKYEDGTSSSGEETYTKPIITIVAYS